MSENKTQNGITEKDRIIYIEPNEIATHNNGSNVSNLAWNQEDLMMSVDLQVIMPSNDDCGQINYFITEKNLVNGTDLNSTTPWASLMEGNLEYNGKKYITTDYTNISYSEYENGKVVSKEDLGIKSIDINFDAHFYPIVTMKMTDVRGNSLFLPSEYEFQQNVSGNAMDEAKRSFFRALFRFPYPRFLLSVKGFYGSKITFTLAVSDFKTQFNSESGDFEITVKFIGYVYGVYIDLPLDLIISSPLYNVEYWKTNDAFRYRNGSMEGNEILNYIDYLKKIQDINNNKEGSDNTISVNESQEYNDLVEENNEINNLIISHNSYYENIIKKGNINNGVPYQIFEGDEYDMIVVYQNKENSSFGISGLIDTKTTNDLRNNIYDEKYVEKLCNLLIRDNKKKISDYLTSRLNQDEKECDNGLIIFSLFDEISGTTNNETKGLTYTLDFSKMKELNTLIKFTDVIGNNVYFHNTTNDGQNVSIKYYGFKGDNNKIERLICNYDKKLAKNISEKKIEFNNFCARGDINTIKYALIKKKCLIEYLEERKSTNEKRIDDIENSCTEKVKETFEINLGSNQSVENMYRMLFAHIDCFMNYFYTKINEISKHKYDEQRSPQNLGLDKDNSDIKNSDNTFTQPFPAYYINDGGKRIMEFPGNAENNSKLRSITEVDMVKEMVHKILDSKYEMENVLNGDNGFNQNVITINDFFKDNELQPWNTYGLKNERSTKDIRNILYIIASEFIINKCYDYVTFTKEDKIKKWIDLQVEKWVACYKNHIYNVEVFKHEIQQQLNVLNKEGWYDNLTSEYREGETGGKLIMDLKQDKEGVFYVEKENVVSKYNNAFGGKSDKNIICKYTVLPELIISGYNDDDYFDISTDKFNKYYDEISGCGVSNIIKDEIYYENIINHLYLNGDSGTNSVYTTTDLYLWQYNGKRGELDEMKQYKNYFNKGKNPSEKDDYHIGIGSIGDFENNKGLSFPFVHVLTGVYEDISNLDEADKMSRNVFNSIGARKFYPIFLEEKFKKIINYVCSDVYGSNIYSILDQYNHEKDTEVEHTWQKFGYFLLSLISGFNQNSIFRKIAEVSDKGSLLLNTNKIEVLLAGAFITVKKLSSNNCGFIKVKGYSKELNELFYDTSQYNNVVTSFNDKEKLHTIKLFVDGTDENLNEGIHSPIFSYANPNYVQGKNLKSEIDSSTYNKISDNIKDILVFYYKEWIYDLVDNYKEFIHNVTNEGVTINVRIRPKATYINGNIRYDIKEETSKTNVFPKDSTGDRFFTNLYTERVTICVSNPPEENNIDFNVDKILVPFSNQLLKSLESSDIENKGEYLGEESIKDAERKLYYVLKNLYNKWLSTYTFDNWKLNTVKEDLERRQKRFSPKDSEDKYEYSTNTEFNNFLFIDQFYNDISNNFIIDPKTIYNILKQYNSGGLNANVYQFMHLIAERNKLMMLSLPIYNNLYNSQTFEQVFEPNIMYGNNDNTNHYGSSYVLMYMNNASQHSDYSGDNNYNFTNDYIDFAGITSSNYVGLESFSNKNNNEELNYKVAAFAVTFSKQNQMYFKKIDVGMDSSSATRESMANLLMLSDAAGTNGPVEANVTIGQDIYSIYANRSYMCKVEMMGCMNIMPLMYFQLNNIPLFRGAYMITNVSHSITQGNIVTSFSGVRVSRYLQPQVDNYLISNTVKNILKNGKSNTTKDNGKRYKDSKGKNKNTSDEGKIWNLLTTGNENTPSKIPFTERWNNKGPKFYEDLCEDVYIPIYNGQMIEWTKLSFNKYIKDKIVNVFSKITFGRTLTSDEINNRYMNGEEITENILNNHKYKVNFVENGKEVTKVFKIISINGNLRLVGYEPRSSASWHKLGAAIDINKNLDFTHGNPDDGWRGNVNKYDGCSKEIGNPDLGPNEIKNLFKKCDDYSKDTDIQIRTWSHPVVKAFLEEGFGWGIFPGSRYDFMHFSFMTSQFGSDTKYTKSNEIPQGYPTLKKGH